MFECSLPCFLVLVVSFKSTLTKVSFQYVQKLLYFVYLLILTLNLFSIVICSRLCEVVASKVWIPRSKLFSHVDICWMDSHASSFGPFWDLYGFKTLFWKYWKFSRYGVNKKNCHNLIIFNTCGTLIYHGGCLESIL